MWLSVLVLLSIESIRHICRMMLHGFALLQENNLMRTLIRQKSAEY